MENTIDFCFMLELQSVDHTYC